MHRKVVSALCAVLAAAACRSAAAAVPVYVMLPLSTVTEQNTLRDPATLASNLQALANIGVAGVMTDVWFGICEPHPRAYNFTGYQQLADLVAKYGLKMQAVMSFHKCGTELDRGECYIPLPQWVLNTTGIFYTDRHGYQNDEYISLFADQVPVFPDGRTPVQVYKDFMAAFARAMGSRMGRTVVEIQVGLGPTGELRYPSYSAPSWSFCGVGEFQCYDMRALQQLHDAAIQHGQANWGYAGPANAGDYTSRPANTGFFGNGPDNYQSPYGQFFLSWYSNALIQHGDRVLEAAASVFHPVGTAITGKVSGVHWWYKDSSHAAELTAGALHCAALCCADARLPLISAIAHAAAPPRPVHVPPGYYNTNNNNAYSAIVAMFKKHGAIIDFTCLEMQTSEQDPSCASAPFELVQQVKQAAAAAGVGFAGENALPRYDATAYNTIVQQSQGAEGFTYLRLGSELMQSGNLQTFQQFVQRMNQL